MTGLVHEKFREHPDLAEKLLSTGDAYLIEGNTWRDRTWGMTQNMDGTWTGRNLLGQILMAEREKMRWGKL